jgi:hypothetical protein
VGNEQDPKDLVIAYLMQQLYGGEAIPLEELKKTSRKGVRITEDDLQKAKGDADRVVARVERDACTGDVELVVSYEVDPFRGYSTRQMSDLVDDLIELPRAVARKPR